MFLSGIDSLKLLPQPQRLTLISTAHSEHQTVKKDSCATLVHRLIPAVVSSTTVTVAPRKSEKAQNQFPLRSLETMTTSSTSTDSLKTSRRKSSLSLTNQTSTLNSINKSSQFNQSLSISLPIRPSTIALSA